ncbi:DUF3592 domain-containing protein [Halorubellus salinus]|uniref:DUF3592 domain-containing protein n=1 Tax=Halorubellus salinus TaxID=755309 RepID=UPI001D0942BB|nr:DUF3592 domain-containing protein [Halorubellus salinus]
MVARSLAAVVLMVVFGLVFAGVGGYLYVEERRAIENSEPVDATVVSAEVVVETDRDSDGDVTRSYRPDVVYRYEVDGESYEGDNVIPGPGSVSKGQGWANRVVDEHPPGANVTAYVDRDDPTTAFLVKERQTLFHAIFVGVGLVTSLAGVAWLGRLVLFAR